MIEQLEAQLIEESKTPNIFTQIKVLLKQLKKYFHLSLLKYRS
jgi:hypothetical protein